MSERLKNLTQILKKIPMSTIHWIKNHKKVSIPFILIGVSLLLLNRLQNKLIYLPQIPNAPRSPQKNPFGYRNPNEQGIQYEDLVINTKDNVQLKGWHCKAPNAERTIIYFHQNAGNIGFRIPFIKEIMMRTHSNVILVAYRGYSDSSGTPTQKGLIKDAQAIMSVGMEISQHKPVYVFGRSLGGAVAIDVVSKMNVKGLILQNTFTRLEDVVYHVFGFLGFLRTPIIWIVLNNYWHSIQKIKNIKADILFIKSRRDELIPTILMDKLQRQAEKNNINTEQYEIMYGTHNQSWTVQPQDYFRRWNEFFNKLQN